MSTRQVGHSPDVWKCTFSGLVCVIAFLPPAKSGSSGMEAERDKGGGYLMVLTCDGLRGFWPGWIANKVREMWCDVVRRRRKEPGTRSGMGSSSVGIIKGQESRDMVREGVFACESLEVRWVGFGHRNVGSKWRQEKNHWHLKQTFWHPESPNCHQ